VTGSAYRFRSTEEWKSAIMNLPLFFELMRSVFGNIKTPYNKQRLLEDLFVFLSRDDIQKTILSMIDEDDHRVIAAAALLGDPTPTELEEFFQGEKNSAVLRGHLLNMEERLLLFRFNDDTRRVRRLALNPVLVSILGPLAADTGILFPSQAIAQSDAAGQAAVYNDTRTGEFSAGDDRALGAFFAFVSAEEEFFKTDGIRKKVYDQGQKLFPGLDLGTAAEVLINLGLFYTEGEKFLPVNRKIRRFGELEPGGRREYWAAGLYFNLEEKKGENKNGAYGIFGLSNRISSLASLIHQFCCCLAGDRKYLKATLLKILKILEQQNINGSREFTGRINARVFLDALITAGILKNCAAENYCSYIPVTAAETRGPQIAMDSPFTFILYPGIRFKDILKFCVFADLREEEPFGFELTKTSAVRGFDFGLDSKSMIAILNDLSGNRIDEGLIWTLKDWESRYASVLLHDGLVLYLSQDKQYLADAEPIVSLIQNKIAPGLYVLKGESGPAAAALQRAGVDIVARPRRQTESGYGSTFPSPSGSANDTQVFAIGNPESSSASAPAPEDSPADGNPAAVSLPPGNSKDETKNHFLKLLDKMKLTGPEREELAARIERRVIITETQLDRTAIKHQKLEARGLDYAGKISIVKQALIDGSSLEVSRTDMGTESGVTAGVPSALEKKEGESVLVLKPFSGQESGWAGETEAGGDLQENLIRIPLGKISLLRMIKRSIFNY